MSTLDVDLDITGMTCASCATRVERKLNKLPGVAATVNFATEKARVHSEAPVPVEELIAAVEQAGYGASLPAPPVPDTAEQTIPRDDELASLRQRLIVSAVLAVPVAVLSMIPALQFTYWQWLTLTLAAPVVVWGAWPFHRAAAINARHLASTMDTLRQGVGLRAYGQRDPLVEYKNEAFTLFADLMDRIKGEIAGRIFRATTSPRAYQAFLGDLHRLAQAKHVEPGPLAGGHAAAGVAALEHDVDDAGDRVRTVLRRCAVTQYLDAIDRGDRDRVQVDRRRAATLAAVGVDQRAGVVALAVDQDQGVVRGQAAQLGGTHGVGAVVDRRAREVE